MKARGRLHWWTGGGVRGRKNSRRDGARAPDAYDWTDCGQARNVVVGQRGVGHETPGAFADYMRSLGERDGAVRLEDNKMIDGGAPPLQIAKQAGKVRIGLANEDFLEDVRELQRTVDQAPGRIRALQAQVVLLGKKLTRRTKQLADLKTQLLTKEQVRDKLTDKLDKLPFYRTGLIRDYRLVVFVLVSVGTFDGAVLHSVLKQSTLDPVSIWLTTIAVALMFAAINEPLGRLVAAVGLSEPGSMRKKLAALGLTIGGFALLTSIVMLGIFRKSAADQQNESLTAIAAGGNDSGLSLVVDPTWLAPLQLGACVAGVIAVALYAMGKEGAELRRQLAAAEADVATAEVAITDEETQIEHEHEQIDACVVETFEAEASAAAARGEIISRTQAFKAVVITETALADEMAAIYQAERDYHECLMANGSLWRMAVPSAPTLIKRIRTGAPVHARSDEQTIKTRRFQRRPNTTPPNTTTTSPNGKFDGNPDDLTTHQP